MTDIVERLRASEDRVISIRDDLLMKDAAAEIERLRAKVAMLEEQVIPMRLDTLR